MNPRFYAPDALATGEVVDLPAEETQHLTRVLRLTRGDAVRLFNGRGAEFDGVVEEVSRNRARILVAAPRRPAAEPRIALALAQCVLKGDKMDDVVRDAVMMGVVAIQPTVSTRTEVSMATLERGHRLERWERIAISSAKQSGRAVVPRILPPLPFERVVSDIGELRLPTPALLFVEPSVSAETSASRSPERSPLAARVSPDRSPTDTVALGELDMAPPRETTIVIGPEGGWTADEVTAGASVCRLVTIGGRTVRADAMAVVATAALFAVWREY